MADHKGDVSNWIRELRDLLQHQEARHRYDAGMLLLCAIGLTVLDGPRKLVPLAAYFLYAGVMLLADAAAKRIAGRQKAVDLEAAASPRVTAPAETDAGAVEESA